MIQRAIAETRKPTKTRRGNTKIPLAGKKNVCLRERGGE